MYVVLIVTSDYVNVLLVFVPLGLFSGAMDWSPTVVFILNFLAIIPLAACLSFATEELSSKLGEALGGLLNATFGNAVELIVSVIIILMANHPEIDFLDRSVSSLFRTTNSKSLNRPCSDLSFPICSWSWACASFLVVLRTCAIATATVQNRSSLLAQRRLPAHS